MHPAETLSALANPLCVVCEGAGIGSSLECVWPGYGEDEKALRRCTCHSWALLYCTWMPICLVTSRGPVSCSRSHNGHLGFADSALSCNWWKVDGGGDHERRSGRQQRSTGLIATLLSQDHTDALERVERRKMGVDDVRGRFHDKEMRQGSWSSPHGPSVVSPSVERTVHVATLVEQQRSYIPVAVLAGAFLGTHNAARCRNRSGSARVEL